MQRALVTLTALLMMILLKLIWLKMMNVMMMMMMMVVGVACSPGRAIRDFQKFNFLRKLEATYQQGRQLHRLLDIHMIIFEHIENIAICNASMLTMRVSCGHVATSRVVLDTRIFELPQKYWKIEAAYQQGRQLHRLVGINIHVG